MVWLYHGTSLDNGISIARTGAILSPLQYQIEVYKRSNIFGGDYKRLKEAAERIIFSLYSESEREERVKCVSFAIDDFEKAWWPAMAHENNNGGLF